MHSFWNEIIKFILLTAEPLRHLGALGYTAVFIIALLESLFIIGSLIPGSVGIIFAGFLASRGYYSFWLLAALAALGGIIGDYLSFYLGKKGENFFKAEAKFLKRSHIDRGKRFFDKYGDKSVLLGRFTGSFRPLVPFVAGLADMDKETFFFWNVLSAIIWVLIHLSIGYFFGTSLHEIERWSVLAGVILLILFGGIVIFAVLVQQRRKIFSFLDKKTNVLIETLLESTYLGTFIADHPKLSFWIRARFKRHIFTGLPLTVLVVMFLYFALLFTGIAEQVVNLMPIVSLDQRFINIAISLYNPYFVKWVISVTSLGGAIIAPLVVIGILSYLFFFKRKIFIVPFIFTVGFGEFFNLAGKFSFHRIRPPQALLKVPLFSFPSDHATIAVVLYGFIAYVIMRTSKNENLKVWSVIAASVLIFFIGLSRMYLRVHYFSDVLGGFALGGLSLVAGIILCEYLLLKNNK